MNGIDYDKALDDLTSRKRVLEKSLSNAIETLNETIDKKASYDRFMRFDKTGLTAVEESNVHSSLFSIWREQKGKPYDAEDVAQARRYADSLERELHGVKLAISILRKRAEVHEL